MTHISHSARPRSSGCTITLFDEPLEGVRVLTREHHPVNMIIEFELDVIDPHGPRRAVPGLAHALATAGHEQDLGCDEGPHRFH
jgi:hypothetical protein